MSHVPNLPNLIEFLALILKVYCCCGCKYSLLLPKHHGRHPERYMQLDQRHLIHCAAFFLGFFLPTTVREVDGGPCISEGLNRGE